MWTAVSILICGLLSFGTIIFGLYMFLSGGSVQLETLLILGLINLGICALGVIYLVYQKWVDTLP